MVVDVEPACQARITPHVDVIVAVKHHEVDDEHKVEQAEEDHGALVMTEACIHDLDEAVGLGWERVWAEEGQLAQPVNQEA